MKCLLCVQDFIDKNNLKKHYLNQHRINSKIIFLKHCLKKTTKFFHSENVTDVMI